MKHEFVISEGTNHRTTASRTETNGRLSPFIEFTLERWNPENTWRNSHTIEVSPSQLVEIYRRLVGRFAREEEINV